MGSFRPVNRHGQLQPTRLSDRAVALLVKRAAKAAGSKPVKSPGIRCAGLDTAAATAGVSERAITNQPGHRSMVVARR
jgi:hypothetical protein